MDPTAIAEVTVREVDIALRESFGIATGAQTVARVLFISVALADGTEGWGEAAPFPAVNGETREQALAAVRAATPTLLGRSARAWRDLGAAFAAHVAHAPSARCAVETAVLDALCRRASLPLWALFGGAQTTIYTDLTITTGTVEAAVTAATRIAAEGYQTLKLKVGGGDLALDAARVAAVADAAPACQLLLDGNAALTRVDDALRLLGAAPGRVALFEQPFGRDADSAHAELFARTGVPIAADEGAATATDVARLARAGAAQTVNLKIMKSGIVGALDMAAAARAHGLGLMIGGMVESPLAMSASACLAAGLGGFAFVDLDTPLWMIDAPVDSGMQRHGPRLELATIACGHGARPRG